MRKGAKMAY